MTKKEIVDATSTTRRILHLKLNWVGDLKEQDANVFGGGALFLESSAAQVVFLGAQCYADLVNINPVLILGSYLW